MSQGLNSHISIIHSPPTFSQKKSCVSPNAQLRANFTPHAVTFDITYTLCLLAVRQISMHIHTYIWLARMKPVYFLQTPHGAGGSSLLSVLNRVQPNPEDLVVCVCEGVMAGGSFLVINACVGVCVSRWGMYPCITCFGLQGRVELC